MRAEIVADVLLRVSILPDVDAAALDRTFPTDYGCCMEIDLTPEQQDFVRQAVESGRFPRAEDAIQDALALWVARERRRMEILASVDAARASIARGEGIDITEESTRALAEDINRRGRARFAAGKRADADK
jgi:Arc/MetJ-type ribon-helix-helix transcriptional regulator